MYGPNQSIQLYSDGREDFSWVKRMNTCVQKHFDRVSDCKKTLYPTLHLSIFTYEKLKLRT